MIGDADIKFSFPYEQTNASEDAAGDPREKATNLDGMSLQWVEWVECADLAPVLLLRLTSLVWANCSKQERNRSYRNRSYRNKWLKSMAPPSTPSPPPPSPPPPLTHHPSSPPPNSLPPPRGATPHAHANSAAPGREATALQGKMSRFACLLSMVFFAMAGLDVRSMGLFRALLSSIMRERTQASPLPAPPPPGQCFNTCQYPSDGECDDGGPGYQYSVYDYGTDCDDCKGRSIQAHEQRFRSTSANQHSNQQAPVHSRRLWHSPSAHLLAAAAGNAGNVDGSCDVGGGASRASAMQLYFTGGTQTTEAAFAPGVLALLHTVIWAQTWHQRLTHGGSSRIQALALRRQPLRPGALPFLHRALVLLASLFASLAMLPCTSAHGVAHPGGTLETLDCYSAYYNISGTGACDWTLQYGCPADDHGVGYGCCCSALRLDPASYAGVVLYVYGNHGAVNSCYKIDVGTRIEHKFAGQATSNDQCHTLWNSLPSPTSHLGNAVSPIRTNAIKTQSYTGGSGTCNAGVGMASRRLQVCASSRADILLRQSP
jgi:hypothetical protein